MGQFGEKIGGRRRNQYGVGTLVAMRQIDVRHATGETLVPQRGKHRMAGERLESRGTNEAAARLGQDHIHRRTRLHQQARQLRSLVGRHAAGHTEHDALALQWTHDR